MARRRCQLLLDHGLWARLKADAERLGLSVSALVRQRLAGTGGLPVKETRTTTAPDPSWSTQPAPVEAGPVPESKTQSLALIEF